MSDQAVRADPLRDDGWGWCYRCGESWKRAESHVTDYSSNSGCFPLCEECWHALSPDDRLPYYRMLWHTWASYGEDLNGIPVDDLWDQMVAAVKEGK